MSNKPALCIQVNEETQLRLFEERHVEDYFMKLEKIGMREILPTAPFDFDATFHKPDHFTSGDNYWEPGIRWQTWNWQGKQLGVKFVHHGAAEESGLLV